MQTLNGLRISEREFGHLCDLSLQTLDIADTQVDDKWLKLLQKDCAAKESLQMIALKRCKLVTDVGLEILTKNCKNLRKVFLGHNPNYTENGIIKSLPTCKRLEKVVLSNIDIGNKGLTELAKKCTHLKEVCVNFTNVDSEGVTKLAKYCKDLEKVDLDGCPKDQDASMDNALQHLGKCKRLTRLSLKKTQVTDKAIKALADACALNQADLTGFRALAHYCCRWPPCAAEPPSVNCSNCGSSGASVSLKKNYHLEEIILSKNPGVTIDGVKHMIEKCEGIKLLHLEETTIDHDHMCQIRKFAEDMCQIRGIAVGGIDLEPDPGKKESA